MTDTLFNNLLILLSRVPSKFDVQFLNLPMESSLERFVLKRGFIGLGQLFEKEEAAGKVRVFALVDSWSQTALRPLHDYLSGILKRIPNDGTDSHNDAFDRVRRRSIQYGCSFGYDLSAATDRLPISIQVKLLNALLGENFGEFWKSLLIDRPYYLLGGSEPQEFKYAVGQPMGARSSFTMLGLIHHLLVQVASQPVHVSDK
jgi:hypothetical protein